ncbi:MAG: AMP-binding protein, partial [Gammaproteobacteria bacterium]|nr:AMP-binding protein [Gammaproteobacteria bacterium]
MMFEPRSIPEAFAAAVERYGAAPLVVEGDRALSFVDIDRQSDGVAAALIAAGIRHGDRVALYCPNGAAFVSAYLGIVKAGAVVV